MCGIVGYVGPQQAQEVLIRGLSKLEYQGYDSAGLAVFHEGRLEVRKKHGRLKSLAEGLASSPLMGQLGIAHTRWATHGKPSDINAHPHTDEHGKFAVVHNGIIENYLELKEELMSQGHRFVSETDSEVIAHLLSSLYDGDLLSTVRRAVEKMRGSYALGILCTDHPEQLVAVRLSSPLVVGVGQGEHFIASDVTALLDYTRDVHYLDEGQMAVLTAGGVQLYDAQGQPVTQSLFHVDWDPVQSEKGGYPHFMLKEIHEQPRSLQNTLTGRISADGKAVTLDEIQLSRQEIAGLDRICIVGCGTAYHAGLVGKTIIESLARVPVEVDVASEFRYRDPVLTPNTLVIVVSQSGETADTLAALRESRRRGVPVLGITNVIGSTIAREADKVLLTMAGPEIAVASTKAYTAQLMAFFLLGLYLAQEKGTLEQEKVARYIQQLRTLPQLVETLLKQTDALREVAERISQHRHLFFIGRGLDYAVALEGSLKLKEISYLHSEAYAAGELKHGTLALVEEGTPVVALATQGHLFEKMRSNIKEIRARGAYVWGIGMQGIPLNQDVVDEHFFIPETEPLFSSVLAVIPLQFLAYYTALALGNDVDNPRNLVKSVMVE